MVGEETLALGPKKIFKASRANIITSNIALGDLEFVKRGNMKLRS